MQLKKWGNFIRFKWKLLLCLQAEEEISIALLKLWELRWVTPLKFVRGRGQEQGNKEIHKYTENVYIFSELTQVNFDKLLRWDINNVNTLSEVQYWV